MPIDIASLLKLLPTSDELIKTKAFSNWGIPQDSSIGPETSQLRLKQAMSSPYLKQDVNLAGAFAGMGDVVPFGKKAASAFDLLDTLVPKLDNLLDKAGFTREATKGYMKSVIRESPEWAARLGINDPELIQHGNKYHELNNAANKELNNEIVLKKLGLPVKKTFTPVPSEIPPDPNKVVPFVKKYISDLTNKEIIRIYRGKNPALLSDSARAEGRWFTTDIDKANKYKGSGELLHIDIPKSVWEQSTQGDIWSKYSGISDEGFIPKELADKAKPLNTK